MPLEQLLNAPEYQFDKIQIAGISIIVSIKESTRIGRAKKEFSEIINMNLDLPVPPEIKTFWALSVNKERFQILSRNSL